MKKSLSILFLIFVMIVVLRLAGFTYGYYAANILDNTSSHSVSVVSKKLSVEYLDGTSIMNFEGDYLFPGDSAEKTFTIKNTGDSKSTYNILIDNVLNEFERTQDLRYVLYINNEEVTSGAINNNSVQYLYSNKEIASGATDSVRFVFEYATTNEIQNLDMNKTISFRFNIDSDVITQLEGEIINLNIDNAIVNDYHIFGKTLVETIDNDSYEIKSIGEKTKNLFDIANNVAYGEKNGLTITYSEAEDCLILNGTAEVTGAYGSKDFLIPNTSGTNYGYAVRYISGTMEKPTGLYASAYFGSSDNGTSRANWKAMGLKEGSDSVYVASCNQNYIMGFWIWISAGVSFDNFKIKVQLEKTDVKPLYYEPYNKYRVSIKNSGKNLLNINELLSAASGEIGGYTATNILELKLKPNTTYTLSSDIFGSIDGLADTDRCLYLNEPNIDHVIFKDKPVTVTTDETGVLKIILFGDRTAALPIKEKTANIQLEENTSSTSYEIYRETQITNIFLDSPLRSVGEHYDYIDFSQQKIFRNVNIVNDVSGNKLLGVNDNEGKNIKLPELKLYSGTNIIEIDNEPLGSNLYLQYYN